MANLSKLIPEDNNYITISCAMNRITVRERSLNELNNPKYISFMVRDDGRAAIIGPTTEEDDEAISVPASFEKRGFFQFGGKMLVGTIRERMSWKKECAYRIAARKIEEKLLLFEFDRAVISASTSKNEEPPDTDSEDEDTTYYWQDTRERALREEDDDEREVMPEPYVDDYDSMHRASAQMQDWGWDRGRISYWTEEMLINTKDAAANYLSWRKGTITPEMFQVHHKELEQMDFAFELGQRVSVIRRIRANPKALNPAMMSIIYDEKEETCRKILGILKRYPQMDDFDIAAEVHWE